MDEDNNNNKKMMKRRNKNNNKKNKNKQPTTEQHKESHVLDTQVQDDDDYAGQVSETINVGGDRDGHLANEAATSKEKIKQLQTEKDAQKPKEAILEEKIKQLLKEKDENLQKEASQKGKMKELHDEKNASMQNEANLKEKFIQLEKEKDALIHKQDCLEQKIKQFESEKDAHLQKEGSLAMKILQLEGERDSWIQKEAEFREKMNQVVGENAALNTKVVGLQGRITQMEKERDSWVLTENSAKESIASLDCDNTNLRAQVNLLEQSRESLLKEKLQLTESISRLQVQINNLESAAGFPHSSMNNKLTSEDGDANSEIEAAGGLVEKLVAENSELVEKVNGLYSELDQRGVRTEYVFSSPEALTAQSTDASALTPDMSVGADDRNGFAQATDTISEARNMMPVSGSSRSLEDIMVEDQRNDEHLNDDGSELANSSEIIEVDEIVQIPLNENETKLEVFQSSDTADVGLTDAPLIGAPFRLISFVARYVSGADLVDKNTGR